MKEEIEQSSGNLYADLGRKKADEMHSKGILARTIYRIIKKRKLTQPRAAKLLGIPQSSLSRLLQGKIAGFSTDRLLRILNQLGQDVDIKIKPIKKNRRKHARTLGRTSIFTVDSSSISTPLAAKSKD
jgi:predicted XRE-type DNA-binding protein